MPAIKTPFSIPQFSRSTSASSTTVENGPPGGGFTGVISVEVQNAPMDFIAAPGKGKDHGLALTDGSKAVHGGGNGGGGLGLPFRRSASGRGQSRAQADSADAGKEGNNRRSLSVAPLLGRLSSSNVNARSHAGTPAAHTPAQTPLIGSTPINPPTAQNLEANYVAKASMRLDALVNRIFVAGQAIPATSAAGSAATSVSALPGAHGETLLVCRGRCAPRVTVAKEFGKVIAEEIQLSVRDPYLLRSILRSAVVRALSIFHSRLDELVTSAHYPHSAPYIPRSAKDVDNQPLAQKFDLEVVRTAYEVKHGLEKACARQVSGPNDECEIPKFVLDGLAPWKEKCAVIMNRFMNPMIEAAKTEITNCVGKIRADETVPTALASKASGKTSEKTGVPALTRTLSINRSSGSINPLSASTPPVGASCPYVRELTGLLDGARALFQSMHCGVDGKIWLVSVGSRLVWKGMLAFSTRRIDSAPVKDVSANGKALGRRTPSPPPAYAAAPTAVTTSALSPSKLLRRDGKRSPSPPAKASTEAARKVELARLTSNSAHLVDEVEAFERLAHKFVADVTDSAPAIKSRSSPLSECPLGSACDICATDRAEGLFDDGSDDEDADPEVLAQEAMEEALQALSALVVIVRALTRPELFVAALRQEAGASGTSCPTLVRALDAIPLVIILHVIASRLPRSLGFRLPHESWGVSWDVYAARLKGFGTAEEWSGDIGWEMAKEIGRVRSAGKATEGIAGSAWLDVLEIIVRVKAGVEI